LLFFLSTYDEKNKKIARIKVLNKITSSEESEQLKETRKAEEAAWQKNKFYFVKFLLMVLIPALVVLKSELGFLIPITLLLIFIIYLYFSSFRRLYIYDRIFLGLEIFLFLAHHSYFVFMFVCQNIS